MPHKIYTRTGDKGMTSLIGGTKVFKSHLRIEAYGTVDELNSWIGYCRVMLDKESVTHQLSEVQDRLFTIGSSLACDPEKEPKMKIPDLYADDIQFLEKEMDAMTEQLQPMKFFILPGGNETVAALHIARCVCRRAERCCVRMAEEKEEIHELIVPYLNRLSDYLFVLSRFAGQKLNVSEIPWNPRTGK
ncbi:MAG: cob(I)yrinic acid a,c-diamide adenosyltransferase [Chitinophagaceae bacterium]|nr:cob(I)yrinic acid a,c-diamide adenosyltransferase [Chitinophagaceae bacterium]